jgi:hypothetical protein
MDLERAVTILRTAQKMVLWPRKNHSDMSRLK